MLPLLPCAGVRSTVVSSSDWSYQGLGNIDPNGLDVDLNNSAIYVGEQQRGVMLPSPAVVPLIYSHLPPSSQTSMVPQAAFPDACCSLSSLPSGMKAAVLHVSCGAALYTYQQERRPTQPVAVPAGPSSPTDIYRFPSSGGGAPNIYNLPEYDSGISASAWYQVRCCLP